MTDQNIERGAAEDNSGTPVTPTEVDASQQAPSRSGSEPGTSEPGTQVPGEHDEAESASGTDV